jgi:hypothetical protein
MARMASAATAAAVTAASASASASAPGPTEEEREKEEKEDAERAVLRVDNSASFLLFPPCCTPKEQNRAAFVCSEDALRARYKAFHSRSRCASAAAAAAVDAGLGLGLGRGGLRETVLAEEGEGSDARAPLNAADCSVWDCGLKE